MEYSKAQLSILNDPSPFLQIVASAGSGKTSTLIALLESLYRKDPNQSSCTLVITFTKKAQTELLQRLEAKVGKSHQFTIQTFHGYAFSVLRQYHPLYQQKVPKILSESLKEQFFQTKLTEQRFRVGGIPYALLLDPLSDCHWKRLFPDLEDTLEKEFQEFKTKHGYLEFQDLVSEFLRGLVQKEPWAETARECFHTILVDEFQDTDLEQIRWLQLLQPQRLVVVGDDWQAIYGFRGASPQGFLEFTKTFPQANIHYLGTNYRSLPKIVSLSAVPIQKNRHKIPKKTKAFKSGKAKIHRYTLFGKTGEEKFAKEMFPQWNPKTTKLLTRTNYRIREWKELGIPEECLMTIHSSKGLEYPTVLIDLVGGWQEIPQKSGGIFRRWIADDSIEEERRILYVGLSRAETELVFLGSPPQEGRHLGSEFYRYFRFRGIPETSLGA